TEHLRSGDTHYPFRQDSDFGYVTGFPEPDAVAVLAPGAEKPFALFVRPRDLEQAIWVGPRAGVEGAVEAYGADVAHPLDALQEEVPPRLGHAPPGGHPARDDALTRRLWALIRYAHALRPRSGSGPAVLRDSGDILHELRLRKDPSEIVRLRDPTAIPAGADAQ